jgi:hypothetical protein
MFRNPDPHSENLGNSGESQTPERRTSDTNNNAKKRSAQRIPPLRSSYLCGFGSSQFPGGSGVLMFSCSCERNDPPGKPGAFEDGGERPT